MTQEGTLVKAIIVFDATDTLATAVVDCDDLSRLPLVALATPFAATVSARKIGAAYIQAEESRAVDVLAAQYFHRVAASNNGLRHHLLAPYVLSILPLVTKQGLRPMAAG